MNRMNIGYKITTSANFALRKPSAQGTAMQSMAARENGTTKKPVILTGGANKLSAVTQVRLLLILFCLICVCTLPGWAFAEAFTIGILDRGGAGTIEKWQPLAEYLQSKTSHSVQILPLPFDSVEEAVKERKVDFLLTNPGMYVELNEKYGLTALASMLNIRQGKSLNQFGGVIFVRKDSPITTVEGLRGKDFMVVSTSSFGGGQMAMRYMIDKGIDPVRDLKLKQGNKHDSVVMAVQEGVVDAGTVRSDTLERMAAEGSIKLDDFRVLEAKKDRFPFVHTTPLYAEWPFAGLAHVDKDTAKHFTAALQELRESDKAAKAAKIAGWTAPLDYTQVAETVKRVKQHLATR